MYMYYNTLCCHNATQLTIVYNHLICLIFPSGEQRYVIIWRRYWYPAETLLDELRSYFNFFGAKLYQRVVR